MPPPQPNWQQHEHPHQHKQPRQYQPSSQEYHPDHHQHRERGRRTTRSGDRERIPSQRDNAAIEAGGGTPSSRRHKRNGSYPDLTRLPPPDYRSLPHTHGDHHRHHSQDHKHREKEPHPRTPRGDDTTGHMRRSHTASISTPSGGVSRHQQTSSVAAEEDSHSRRYYHHPHITPQYPTMPVDRVHFDTLEPYASKLHQQLQHELKCQLGERRRSRSVSLTSRERSLDRAARRDRHHHQRKKERERIITADHRPISPPAQFISLPSTTSAAISSGGGVIESGRKFESQYPPASHKLPSSHVSRADDAKLKGQKTSRSSQHHLAQIPSQIPPHTKSAITSSTVKPSLSERYSTSFSSHQIPPPLPTQGSNILQHKAKIRAKDKFIKSTEGEIDSILSSHKRQQPHAQEHFTATSEESLKHICGLDASAPLLFHLEPEQSRSRVPVALKPQKSQKSPPRHAISRQDDISMTIQHDLQHVQHPMGDVLTDIHSSVHPRVSGSERKISESELYSHEEKQKGIRGRDKPKHILSSTTNGEHLEQFSHPYDRQKITARKQHDDEVLDKVQIKDDRSKRRQRPIQVDTRDMSEIDQTKLKQRQKSKQQIADEHEIDQKSHESPPLYSQLDKSKDRPLGINEQRTRYDREVIGKQMMQDEEQKLKREREERDKRIARRILEKQKEAKAKALNEKLEQELERERLTIEMREKERIAKEMANQERKAIEKAERDRREKLKISAKIQQERDEERRSQRSRIGRELTEARLTRRLSKDVFITSQPDRTYVKGEYVDNIEFINESTGLLMPPEEDTKRERSWDRKSRKSYDSAPPMEDARSKSPTFEDKVKRPSTMPDTQRPQSESHRHKVIVHSKDSSSRSAQFEEAEIFTNGIITHDQPLHSDETERVAPRPRSLISLLPPPPDHDQKTKSKDPRKRKPSASPPCICEYENGGTPPESDSGNQETVLEFPLPAQEIQPPLTPTHIQAPEVEPHIPWDRRSRESKGSRATKTSQSARSQGYASLASSVYVAETRMSKPEATLTAPSRTETYAVDDDVPSQVESVDLCMTTDDHPSMITPSVLGDIITTDDGRGSPFPTHSRPRSHSKSRHHKPSSGGRDRHRDSGHRDSGHRDSGHRDSGHREHQHHQQRQHIPHQGTPKQQHRHYKPHHPEGSDLGFDSRCEMYGLESDYEIEQHIRNCRCPCDHLGHGNYLDYQVRNVLFSLL